MSKQKMTFSQLKPPSSAAVSRLLCNISTTHCGLLKIVENIFSHVIRLLHPT